LKYHLNRSILCILIIKEEFDILEDEGIEVVYPELNNRFEIRSTMSTLGGIE